jgi:hypothetical protein
VPPRVSQPGVVPATVDVASPAMAAKPLTGNAEMFSATVKLPSAEITLWKTSNRWRGCDVYVNLNQIINETLTIKVYAVTGNVRVLVASGRVWPGQRQIVGGAYVPPLPRWVAAARCGATQFEVTAETLSVGAALAGVFDVSVIASNDLVEAPGNVGSIMLPVAPQHNFNGGGGFGGLMHDVEILGIDGFQSAGAVVLYAMIFDEPRPIVNGDIPTLVYPLSNGTIGSGNRIANIRYRAVQTNLTIGVSTTPLLFTASGNGSLVAEVR